MNKTDLLFDLERATKHEAYCQELIDMIDDGIEPLDMTADHAAITTLALRQLGQALRRRINAIDHQLTTDDDPRSEYGYDPANS